MPQQEDVSLKVAGLNPTGGKGFFSHEISVKVSLHYHHVALFVYFLSMRHVSYIYKAFFPFSHTLLNALCECSCLYKRVIHVSLPQFAFYFYREKGRKKYFDICWESSCFPESFPRERYFLEKDELNHSLNSGDFVPVFL